MKQEIEYLENQRNELFYEYQMNEIQVQILEQDREKYKEQFEKLNRRIQELRD